jgi:mono/diheme cytochrome c family protein
MRAFLALAAAVLLLAACKQTTIDDVPCPPGGTTVTYDNFGKGFLAANCQRCHGAATDGRNGAPPDFDFGTIDQVRAHKDRIFARAAEDNTTMPPGPDDPPEADRKKLGEWLACNAP